MNKKQVFPQSICVLPSKYGCFTYFYAVNIFKDIFLLQKNFDSFKSKSIYTLDDVYLSVI